MAGEDDSDKTEDPTQKRLEDARKKGQVPISREANHFASILATALLALTVAAPLARNMAHDLTVFITQPDQIPVSNTAEIGNVLYEALIIGITAIALPLLAFVIAGIAATLLQIGPMYAVENLMPKLERISIMKGVQRLFSRRSFIEFLKGLAKLSVVSIVVTWLLLPVLPGLEHTIFLPPSTLLSEVISLTLRILVGVLCVVAFLTIVDYFLQRLQFMREMRMSRSELKEEYKQTEGDPIVRQRIRQIRMERARRRMMADVMKADVVVTNPDHYAIALQYNPEEHAAPRVLAMGVDLIAQKIKEIARENEIPIVENPPLARALYATAEIDREKFRTSIIVPWLKSFPMCSSLKTKP